MRKIFLFSLLAILAHTHSAAQSGSKGTEFWFGYMENLPLGLNLDPVFYVIISADETTTVKVSVPSMAYENELTIPAGGTAEAGLPGILYAAGSEIKTNLGCHISSERPVSVKMIHGRSHFSEGSIVYPTGMLGTSYQVLTHEDALELNPSSFLVVATENDSRITITPSVSLLFRPPYQSFSITLQRGQTYQVQSNKDLSGSVVECSNGKKIALFCGARMIQYYSPNIRNLSATSHVFEQILPIQYAAREFLYIPLASSGGDPLRILALQDQTTVLFNGKTPMVLKKGSSEVILEEATMITSDKPIFIAQFITYGKIYELGDPNMFYLLPLHFKGNKDCFKTYPGLNGVNMSRHFINAVCLTKDTQSLWLDQAHPRSGFKVLGSNPKYAYASIEVEPGTHCLRSDSGFNAYAYGYGFADAYSFSLGFSTGIRDEKQYNYGHLVFPNPTTDHIKIRYAIPRNTSFTIQYELYDAIAQKITGGSVALSNSDSEIILDMEHLAASCYFLRISEPGNKTYVYKIVKM